MRGTVLATVVVATIVVAGCSDGGSPKRTVSDEIRDVKSSPSTAEPANDVRRDRDASAVAAALWRLDACGLVGEEPDDEHVHRHSPHSCEVGADSIQSARVTVGTVFDASARYGTQATTVAGAKAYVLPGAESVGCRGWLPVSFTQSIGFRDERKGCGRVRELMTRAVHSADRASSRQVVPGLGKWDTCSLLRRGLPHAGPFAYGQDSLDGIDTCQSIPRDISSSTVSLEAESLRDRVLTFEEGATSTPSGDDLASAGWPDRFGSIRGRNVFGSKPGDDGGCTMRWAEDTTVLMLKADSCGQGTRAATAMMRTLDGSRNRAVTPQRSLLFRAGESDIAAAGACVDYMPLGVPKVHSAVGDGASQLPVGSCNPYEETELPRSAARRVVAASADPNVTCRLASHAVDDEFGQQKLRPVTLERLPTMPNDAVRLSEPVCVFTDPARRVQVTVVVSTREIGTLAPAVVNVKGVPRLTTGSQAGMGQVVGLGTKGGDPGFVGVFVGDRPVGATGTVPNPAERQRTATRVVNAIVDDYLQP